MALDAQRKSNSIVDALKAINPDITGDVEDKLREFWDIVCAEDVKEIVDNAEVNTDITVDSVSGVLPGGGVSGPGNGSGSGTIT